MRKLYTVNPDGTITFLEPVNVESKEKFQETKRVAVHRFWEARKNEGKSYRHCGTPA